MKRRRALGWGSLMVGLAMFAHAEPKPGDVFREHVWRQADGKWQRITAPEAQHEGAKKFLPNAVNTIELADLAGATRVEVQLELLQSHYGTVGHALRVNGGEWQAIPQSPHVPGTAGRGDAAPEMWLTMLFPTLELPLSALKQGKNTFELTCKPGKTGLGLRWPQSIVYAAIFRVYYGADKPAPTGRVVATTGVPNRFATIELAAEPKAAAGRTIRRVDFFARYQGYDWRGEGVRQQWHYQTFFGALRRHAGSSFEPPWKIAWDIRGVPAQDAPVQIVARIEDDHGLCRMTDALTLEKFRGEPNTRIFAAHDVPPHWQTRAGRRHTCKITLPENLSRVAEAKLILATWNADQCDELGLNGTPLLRNFGHNHDLSYDEITVPIGMLRPGDNELHTTSATEHHGIEVLWPGAVLLVRFAPLNSAH